MNHQDNAAGIAPAAGESMPEDKKPTLWQSNRMAIILGIMAVCFYLGSIVWMAYARG